MHLFPATELVAETEKTINNKILLPAVGAALVLCYGQRSRQEKGGDGVKGLIWEKREKKYIKQLELIVLFLF